MDFFRKPPRSTAGSAAAADLSQSATSNNSPVSSASVTGMMSRSMEQALRVSQGVERQRVAERSHVTLREFDLAPWQSHIQESEVVIPQRKERSSLDAETAQLFQFTTSASNLAPKVQSGDSMLDMFTHTQTGANDDRGYPHIYNQDPRKDINFFEDASQGGDMQFGSSRIRVAEPTMTPQALAMSRGEYVADTSNRYPNPYYQAQSDPFQKLDRYRKEHSRNDRSTECEGILEDMCFSERVAPSVSLFDMVPSDPEVSTLPSELLTDDTEPNKNVYFEGTQQSSFLDTYMAPVSQSTTVPNDSSRVIGLMDIFSDNPPTKKQDVVNVKFTEEDALHVTAHYNATGEDIQKDQKDTPSYSTDVVISQPPKINDDIEKWNDIDESEKEPDISNEIRVCIAQMIQDKSILQLTRDQLREVCDSLNLQIFGSKDELLKRIDEYVCGHTAV